MCNIWQREKFGRRLIFEELEAVQKGVEFDLECWEDVVVNAIDELKDVVVTNGLEQ